MAKAKSTSRKKAATVSFKTRLSVAAQLLGSILAGNRYSQVHNEPHEHLQDRLSKDALAWADALIEAAQG